MQIIDVTYFRWVHTLTTYGDYLVIVGIGSDGQRTEFRNYANQIPILRNRAGHEIDPDTVVFVFPKGWVEIVERFERGGLLARNSEDVWNIEVESEDHEYGGPIPQIN